MLVHNVGNTRQFYGLRRKNAARCTSHQDEVLGIFPRTPRKTKFRLLTGKRVARFRTRVVMTNLYRRAKGEHRSSALVRIHSQCSTEQLGVST